VYYVNISMNVRKGYVNICELFTFYKLMSFDWHCFQGSAESRASTQLLTVMHDCHSNKERHQHLVRMTGLIVGMGTLPARKPCWSHPAAFTHQILIREV